MKKLLLSLAFIVITLGLFAQVGTFTLKTTCTTGTCDWVSASSWNTTGSDADGIPDSDDIMRINGGGVTISVASSVASVTINQAANALASTLIINNGINLTLSGIFAVNSTAGVTSSGLVTLTNGVTSGMGGTISTTRFQINASTGTKGATTLTNNGTITTTQATTAQGFEVNTSSGTYGAVSITNTGTINVTGAGADFVINRGATTVATGLVTLNNNAGGQIMVIDDFTVNGLAGVYGAVTINNSGTITPQDFILNNGTMATATGLITTTNSGITNDLPPM